MCGQSWGCVSLVPVLFGDAVEGVKHDGHDHAGVGLDQPHHPFIVPVAQSSLCYLEDGDRGNG